MADVNANIGVNIDTSEALAQLKSLQRQISTFHTSIAKSSETAALAQQSLAKNLINSINSIGAFSAELRTVKTTSESFTDSLEKNKFSMREYFRYAGGATKTFGKLFRSEFDTISNVAEERVKRLQTQYIKLGRDSSGAMKSIAVMPTSLNMEDYNTKLQIAAQRQQLFNQLMRQGSTNLINFGKNTQWAGRQLMVGFTIPLSILGNTASRAFMDMETQALKFRKVYGDLFTPREETQKALEDIQSLASMFTQYGVAASQTVGLAAEAAAAGFAGIDLQRQTAEATRLSILGQIDSQKALETTISLQNAFKTSSAELADQINFLNAVENQTVVSLDDITTAIPKVAPVIQQLGGNVKDLAFFLAAMKEGGVNASEGANALKSGLAALINPTEKASAMLAGMGINIKGIIEANKGNLKNTVVEFARALDTLDPLTRARAIEQLFGKFQFARLSTLFANVTQSGNQASRVLDLANASVQELANLSEQELEISASSSMNKFKKAIEDLRLALVPVGETFLSAITPIIDFIGQILEKFNNLSSGVKKVITVLTVGLGAVGPVLLMTFGLLANGIGNLIKLFLTLRGGYQRLTGQTNVLGQQTQYMTSEQLDAAAAAHSLDQAHAKLTQQFLAEAGAVMQLRNAYQAAIKAGQNFALNNPGSMIPSRGAKKLASGIVSVPGPKGAGDIVPAMLSPGEAVIPADMTKKYGPLIKGMVSDNIPGYKRSNITDSAMIRLQDSYELGHYAPPIKMTGQELQDFAKTQTLSVQQTIEELINSVKNGLNHAFDVFTNEVTVQSTELNQAIGEVGSGKKAPIELFRQEAVAGAGAYNAPLLVKMQEAGASTEELDDAVKKLADEFDQGISRLGDKATITAEEINNITTEAYKNLEKTNKTVKTALEKMQEPGAMKEQFGSVKTGGRTKFRGAYNSSTSRTKVNKMVQQNLPGRFPTQQAAVFKGSVAQDLGIIGAIEIREIFRKLDLEAKKRVEAFAGDIRKMSKQVIAEATKAGIDIGEYTIKGISTAVKVSSPSKETERVGKEIARGLEVGMTSRQDDVALVGSNLGKSAVRGINGGATQIPFRAPGQPGFISGGVSPTPTASLADITAKARFNRDQLLATQQAKRMQAMNIRMDRLNRAFMSGTFALSALSGVTSMAGGNLGKFSEILFQISGPLFALSSILQMFTGKKILTILSGVSKLKFGAAALALTAVIALYKWNSNRLKENNAKLYAFGNAITNTKEQIKALGDYFGVVPTRTGLENTTQEKLVSNADRAAINQFKESDTFKQYTGTIDAVSRLSDADATLALQTKGAELLGKGFSKDQVNIIITAIQEAAGKSDLKINFKAIKLEDLQRDIETGLAAKLAALPKFINDTMTSEMRMGENGRWYRAIIMGPEAQAEIKNQGAAIKAYFNGLSGMIASGQISFEQFNQSFDTFGNLIKTNIPDASQQLAILNATLEQMDGRLAKGAIGIQSFESKLLLAKAAAIGLNLEVTNAMVNALMMASLPGATAEDMIRASAVASDIEKMIAIRDKAIKALNKPTGTNTGGDGEKSWLQKLKDQTTATLTQTKAFYEMRKAGIEAGVALELASNPEFAEGIKKAAEGTGKAWTEAVEAIKNYTKAQEALKLAEVAAMNQGDYELQRLNKAQAYLDLQSQLIRMEYSAQLESISKSQEENDLLLQRIAYQETLINNRYNPIIDRLQKIESLNKSISEIESRRLDLVSALSSGDVSGGIKALQDLRSTRASQTTQSQIDNLNAAKERELSLITQNKLTKDQIDLQNQKLSLDKREIENIISKKEAALTYFNMTKTQIDNAARTLDLAKSAGIDINSPTFLTNVLDAAIGKTNSLKLAADEAAKSFAAMLGAQVSARSTNAGLPTMTALPQLFTTTVGGTKITTPWDTGAGKAIGRSMGGIIPKYFANGGMSRGTDTIPAMLTPGEFVIRKSTVDQLGVNTLTNLNNGNSSLGSVYNYSLSVNVDGTSANANDIARVVMSEIKKVDSQRIRGVR